ncbi:MAG: hypothetical protein KIS77_07865 [Saprospiraceae bacterium]|nr:hypothetical protein [Saprospiraceae bacterium]
MRIQHLYFSFLFISLMAQGCQQKSEQKTYERIERVESGAITRRVQIVNGKKEGKMTDYYPDGKLRGERWFENDLQTGRTVLYHPNGQVMEVQYYAEGKKQGGDTLWYDNGQVQFTTWFEGGKMDGYLRKWSPEGQLIFEALYQMDSLVEVRGKTVGQKSKTEN